MSHDETEIGASFHLLDRQLIDGDGVLVGKIDDLELDLEPGVVEPGTPPPRVTALLSGWGAHEPTHIDVALIRDFGSDVQILESADELTTHDGERWLRKHFVHRIPGSRRAAE
jgi:sporulation protein YlmC with PRC-barrel domain